MQQWQKDHEGGLEGGITVGIHVCVSEPMRWKRKGEKEREHKRIEEDHQQCMGKEEQCPHEKRGRLMTRVFCGYLVVSY